MGVLNGLAMTVKNVGQDVMNGMRGDVKNFTKQYGQRILKSNMTEQQIKEIGVDDARKFINNKAKKQLGNEVFDKITNVQVKKVENNLLKKGLQTTEVANKIRGGKYGSAIEDKLIGRKIAQDSLGFKIGDAVGGGVRDTYRSMKSGHDFKTALSAGFTQKVGGEMVDYGNGVRQMVGGKTQIRMDRIAGAAFGAGVIGRVASGGGLYRDRYGRVNAPGIPFI